MMLPSLGFSLCKKQLQRSKMKLHQLSALFCLAATLGIAYGHIGGHMTVQDIKPKIYCGRRLADMLAILCSDDMNKRSGMYNSIPSYYDMPAEMNWPWLAPHKARAVSMPARGKRYVVSECCDKACTIDELLSYC